MLFTQMDKSRLSFCTGMSLVWPPDGVETSQMAVCCVHFFTPAQDTDVVVINNLDAQDLQHLLVSGLPNMHSK